MTCPHCKAPLGSERSILHETPVLWDVCGSCSYTRATADAKNPCQKCQESLSCAATCQKALPLLDAWEKFND